MKDLQRKAMFAKHKEDMKKVEKRNDKNDNRVFTKDAKTGKKIEVSPPYGGLYPRVKRSPSYKKTVDKHLAERNRKLKAKHKATKGKGYFV